MFITSAMAQVANQPETVDAATSNSGMRILLQLLVIFFIFYLFLIRPQQKRAKEHNRMLNSITKGTQVVFGGVVGKVMQVLNEQEVLVEISTGVQVKVLRSFISQVVQDMDVIQDKSKAS